MNSDNFKFDLNAKKTRITDNELLLSLKDYSEQNGVLYFKTIEYDKWRNKKAHSSTIIDRFGSWKKALQQAGLTGGREYRYSIEELIANLEDVWKELGYPPGKRQLGKYGQKISESPYKTRWGSVSGACKALADYHAKKISWEKLLAGINGDIEQIIEEGNKRNVPSELRFKVFKRDNFRCVLCGKSPSTVLGCQLHADHIIPYSKGGKTTIENLRTTCADCNLGRSNKH